MNCWQGIKGEWVPTVHHARHYLLAHMSVGTGPVPRGPQAFAASTHCQEAEVNMSVCVCGGESERDSTWANSRLKQIEKEFSQKLAKSAQHIAELQTSVCDSKEEAVRLQQVMEKQLKESNVLWDEERRTIIQHADRASKALREKVENLQRQLHCSEKKLLSKELETEEKVTVVRQEYEEKIKGLMPAELQQELEDTITSLKTQVNFLQKRASVLQEDLKACRSRR